MDKFESENKFIFATQSILAITDLFRSIDNRNDLKKDTLPFLATLIEKQIYQIETEYYLLWNK